MARLVWSKWKKVDETPYQDEAKETVKEMKEDDKESRATAEYKTKMKYGKIHDPSRPLFVIWRRFKYVKAGKEEEGYIHGYEEQHDWGTGT
jgi:hypothetical protein